MFPLKLIGPQGSVLFLRVLVIVVAFGIIIIGVREFLYPGVGALGFGVPLHDTHGSDLLAVKAVRDVVSGYCRSGFSVSGIANCLPAPSVRWL